MKAKALVLMLVAATALTACHKDEHVKAVDKLEEAQAMALEKAPKAEEMKFDDHGQKPFAEVKAPEATTDAQADTSTDAPKESESGTESKTDANNTDTPKEPEAVANSENPEETAK